MITFYLINQTNGLIQDTELLRTSEILLRWLDSDVKYIWGLAKLQYNIKVLAQGKTVPQLDRTFYPIYLTAESPIVSENGYREPPPSKVAHVGMQTSTKNDRAWTAVVGTLILESILNPSQYTAIGPIDGSKFYMLHVCAPAANLDYTFENIIVPNFTYPSFWTPDGASPFDRMQQLPAPFTALA